MSFNAERLIVSLTEHSLSCSAQSPSRKIASFERDHLKLSLLFLALCSACLFCVRRLCVVHNCQVSTRFLKCFQLSNSIFPSPLTNQLCPLPPISMFSHYISSLPIVNTPLLTIVFRLRFSSVCVSRTGKLGKNFCYFKFRCCSSTFFGSPVTI